MYAITGVTGQVGGAVVRDAEKGARWAEQGCDVALAEIEDVQAKSRGH